MKHATVQSNSAHISRERKHDVSASFPERLKTFCWTVTLQQQLMVIGIRHVFHALTFAKSRGYCLKMRPTGRVFKHLLRDPASVNAMKQTYVIVILAYFTLFQPNLQ